MRNRRRKIPAAWLVGLTGLLAAGGCAGPGQHLAEADRAALKIIAEKQTQALGREEPFSILPPAEILRRRLILGQGLLYSHPASLGSRDLNRPPAWPDIDSPGKSLPDEKTAPPWGTGSPLTITMVDALRIGARNNRDYQAYKEDIFRAALNLDLERNEFRNLFTGLFKETASTDMGGAGTESGLESGNTVNLTRKLGTGLAFTAKLGIDLVRLLTMDRASSLGVFADATITMPLLRGAGRDIVQEPLRQAERKVVYAIYRFERFRRTYAVQVASNYLAVLRQLDEINNSEENHKNLQASATRARRLAEAGRLPEVQVDQTIQDALRARDRWLTAQQTYARRLDDFKVLLGLPPDAEIELNREEIKALTARTGRDTERIDAEKNMRLALDNRLDLRIAQGEVFDKQRAVLVAADNLRADATITATGNAGENRSLAGATLPSAKLRPEQGAYSALLSLGPPFERTAERNEFRKSLIDLERAVRALQKTEDQVKLDVRNRLRDLVEFRERIAIQTKAVEVAERRVAGTTLFLRAGRVQMRDLLEAREALLQARNNLTAARVDYRVAKLALLRDLGTLAPESVTMDSAFPASNGTLAGNPSPKTGGP